MFRRPRKSTIAWTLFVAGAFALAPLNAETIDEKKGREAHEALSLYTHFYTDEEVNAYVNEIGQKLVANSDWPDYKFHFFVVDSPGINAFAADGGYIYINRGLLSCLLYTSPSPRDS